MRRPWLVGLLGLFVMAMAVWAGNPDTANKIPQQDANFMPDLQRFLREEDAIRYKEILGQGMVTSGGLHGPVAGLVGTPSPMIAYPGGARVTEEGSIAYPNSANCWVIATRATSGNPPAFTRVANTHFAIDCVSPTLTVPPDSVELMKVTTSGGAITTVVDLRPRYPLSSFQVGKPSVGGSITFYGPNSTIPVTLQAGATTAPQTYTWPLAPPAGDGYVLTTTSLGQWSWTPGATFTARASPMRFIQQGSCAVGKVIQALMERPATITSVWVWSDTPPAGADLIVDVRVNGGSVFGLPTSAPRVLVGAQAGQTTTIEAPNVAAGDRIGIWILQTGTTTPGCNDLLATVSFGS